MITEGDLRFPGVVQAELDRRRASMLADGRSRVLDLTDPSARDLLRGAIDANGSAVVAEWDLVVSMAELVRYPDLPAALDAIDHLLVPNGRFVAIEPVARPGTLRVIASAPWSATKWVRGVHVGRDLMAALRTTTLVNDDIERFTLPTAVAPLRHFVALGARRVDRTTEVHQ